MEPATENTDRPRARTARTVLVVDDNQLITRALQALLAKAGYVITAFETGLAALRHAAENRPDAAIIDVHLPDISGLVLTQQLRDLLGPRTPLIVLSGDTSMATINSLQHVGATYFFPKPVRAADLVERLNQCVG